MTTTYQYSTTLVVVTCGTCNIPHGLPADLQAAREADGDGWYCPNGHYIAYIESETKRLRRQLKRAEDAASAARAERDQAQASRRAWKGQATRARKAVLAGQCTFCGQHLRDLERHVTRMHGDEAAKNPDTEPVA